MNDYERIASVIRHLDEHHAEQPDLGVLAERTGLSPSHFHRLFSAWAGVTPKDFLQCLTLAHVKAMLLRGQSALHSALEAGLSGPGRLHDLCVNLEAASPGELKTGGAQWTIVAGFGDSPFGTCLIGESPRGICHLSFVEDGDEDAAWSALRADWPNARLARDDSKIAGMVQRIFVRPSKGNGKPPHPGPRSQLRAFVSGTPFQVRVWRALIQIPPGNLITYGRLAAAIGHPTAARAVGSAVGQNPVAYLIPCHRVIRETCVIGDYHWGRTRKHALIAWENAASRTRFPPRTRRSPPQSEQGGRDGDSDPRNLAPPQIRRLRSG
jgi:AraC family transcriptional regulator of adaptative response/methylated-DNA-[protein]-cysteine methyltransferase